MLVSIQLTINGDVHTLGWRPAFAENCPLVFSGTSQEQPGYIFFFIFFVTLYSFNR